LESGGRYSKVSGKDWQLEGTTMNEPVKKLQFVFTVGPLLNEFIRNAGYEPDRYAEMIGMAPVRLKQILEGGDPLWSELNRIVKPLGYQLVFEKIHPRTPRPIKPPRTPRPINIARKERKSRVMIRRVKFKGEPLKTE
jgi:hypothetical protein